MAYSTFDCTAIGADCAENNSSVAVYGSAVVNSAILALSEYATIFCLVNNRWGTMYEEAVVA
jgi:hypothetical protein